MVEYKKKKLILQSGGTRNYYYKVSSNGKKKQVSKNEYLEKKGGSEILSPDELLKSLDTIIDSIYKGKQNRENYDKFMKLALEIDNQKLEIPTVFKWKSAFDDVRKMHFKANGSRVNKIPRPASNSWEGSFVMSLWGSLFH